MAIEIRAAGSYWGMNYSEAVRPVSGTFSGPGGGCLREWCVGKRRAAVYRPPSSFPVLPFDRLGDGLWALNESEGSENIFCDVHGLAGRQLQCVRVDGATPNLRLHLLVPALVRGGDHLL